MKPTDRVDDAHAPRRRASQAIDARQLFSGGGEMAELMRETDWARTELGPIETWPTSLRTMLSVVLRNRFPMNLLWGEHLVQLYNDAYRPVLGAKHPASLAAPAREVWAEIWDVVGIQAESVMAGGPATWNEHLMLEMKRNGFIEETFFTFSYSPVTTDSGEVGGVLVTVQETTTQVQDERQLRTLGELGARAFAEAGSAEQSCRAAAEILAQNEADAPYGLVYLVDSTGVEAALAASWGFGVAAPQVSATVAMAGMPSSDSSWGFQEAMARGALVVVSDLGERVPFLPRGRWPDRPHRAVCVPMLRHGQLQPLGFLIVGVSPTRPLDERYKSFFRRAADQICVAVANARAREDERRRTEALAELDRAKTAFFGNVSHEFRTPLTLLLGPTEDLLRGVHGPLDPRHREQLAIVERNALRLQKLVNSLLDVARIEGGSLRARREALDLAALTREIADSFRPAIERAGLAFDVECPELGTPIPVDREMWEKIVLNLLSNALKFTFQGCICVRLRADEHEAVLEVRDSGVGIPKDEVPKLFERFHRIPSLQARTHEGSGIGLALVSELVGLHQGRVTVATQEGTGTTFSIQIPVSPAISLELAPSPRHRAGMREAFLEDVAQWSVPASSRPPLPEVVGASQEKVLVVDDNADMRSYLERLLRPYWRVQCAADGVEALAKAKEWLPDLVLSDVMMPNLDGFGLLDALRADRQFGSIPFLLLSARAGEESRLEGLERGADDYLVKPFSAREIVARVRLHLELARLRRAAENETKRLLSLFRQIPAVICVLRGPDLHVELANPPTCLVADGRMLEGSPLLEAVPELADQGYPEMLREVQRTGVSASGRAAPIRVTRNGSGETYDTYWDYSVIRISDSDDRTPSVLVFAIDVTEQVRGREEIARLASMREEKRAALEQALGRERTLREQAERAVQFSELLVGVVGHDLRNPLNAIMMGASLLTDLENTSRVPRIAERLVSSADRMRRMVEQLLDFTRIRLGGAGLPLSLVDGDLGEIVRAVVEETQRARPDCEIRSELSGKLTGRWDKDRMGQLVSNLTANACQHGLAGEPIVVRAFAQEDDTVRIEVANRGIIPAERQAQLFEPLAGERKKSRSGGLGLGLFISKEIAVAHGGTIRAVSDTEAGTTTFVVELPREAAASHAFSVPPPASPASGTRTPSA